MCDCSRRRSLAEDRRLNSSVQKRRSKSENGDLKRGDRPVCWSPYMMSRAECVRGLDLI